MRHLLATGHDFPNYINADDIAVGLPETGVAAAKKAQKMFWALRDGALRRRESVTYETVMSHPSHIQTMRAAAADGYRVALIFVGLEDPALNVGRVADRVAKGGHDVPQDRILARYEKTMTTALPAAVAAADTSLIFDNSPGASGKPDWSHGSSMATRSTGGFPKSPGTSVT